MSNEWEKTHNIVPFQQPQKLPLFDIPVLKGDINPGSVEVMAELLEAEAVEGNKTVDFVVSSWGGMLDEALILTQDMQRMRETYGVKFRVVAKGYADSSATILVASADERIAYSDTEFLLHEPRITTEEGGESTLSEARYEVFTTRKLQRRAWKLLARKTGKSIAEIRAKERENKPMTAHEALSFGLIDKVVIFDP